ncbi:ABC-2 type transport system ATP-binding protein [Microbacterium trichothecenolyticum]|uniref:ABC transporter ATP-binding protein n=1 Tax=Microbacterium trichothecenolyticum TaxID=69370 RepID=UPI0028628CE4|nr:ABC transporter ATP-binding protein [Microbacterium trichothecenolyticum]MDR7185314.1 ABC-2 type transport system ATP-binding protein [Microbacterium trichothecenolyticum]
MSNNSSAAPEIVRLDGVRKVFTVRKDNSLKDRIVHFGRLGHAYRQHFVALDDATLAIEAGTTVGLLGANGSGKSTMLKLIGGILAPTEGTVHTRGRMAALLELGAGFHPDLSGRENVYLNAAILGLTHDEIEARFDDIVAFSGVEEFIDTAVKFYSSGMYVRLAFAVAVHTDPDILLVDEVLAVGDEAFQRKCMDRIQQFRDEGRTIILVSHSAQQVAELCDRGIVLQAGKVVYDGETNGAISALRDVLDGRRVGEAPPDATRHPIQVKRIEVIDGSGTVTNDVRVGEPLTMRIHVDSLRPIERWEVGFSIDTPLGHMVLASNTDLLKVRLAPIVGPTVVDLTIDEVHFGAGQYYVNANAAGVSESSSHGLMQGARFTVLSEPGTVGSVSAHVSVAAVAGEA